MYFNTSQDLLFFILAVAVAVISVFLVWGLYYMVMILKKAYHAVQEVEEKLASLDALFTTVKEHLMTSSESLKIMATVVAKLIKVFQQKKEKKQTDKKTNKVE
ncbi:MAG: hypothetical protein V1853_04225 [bacterium]